jgi:hypothetical protein
MSTVVATDQDASASQAILDTNLTSPPLSANVFNGLIKLHCLVGVHTVCPADDAPLLPFCHQCCLSGHTQLFSGVTLTLTLTLNLALALAISVIASFERISRERLI